MSSAKSVINCHYADDTILFAQADPKNIELIWWTLRGFEALSGIKINFDKIELYPLNISSDCAQVSADIFGCKISAFPFKYLGLPLSNSKLLVKYWEFLIKKVENKLQNWKGRILSLGGQNHSSKLSVTLSSLIYSVHIPHP